MKQTLLTLVALLLLLGSTLMAQEPHYVAGQGYDKNMIYIAVVRVDGEYLVYDSQVPMEVGYFTVDGGAEVTLGSNFMIAPPSEFGHNYSILNATIPFDSEGQTVTFKLYNHSTGQEYAICPKTVQTVTNGNIGNPFGDEVIDFYSPIEKDIIGYGGDSPDAPAGHFYLIASPIGEVSPEDVTNMLNTVNGYDLYYFDQSQSLEWVNYKGDEDTGNPGGFSLEPGKGYLYANHDDVTLQFNDVTYTCEDDYVVTLVRDDNQPLKGWNLVGNPINEVTYITKSFYTMSGDGTEIVPATSTSVEPMEGIFVIADENGETMTFSTEEPAQGNRQLVVEVARNRGGLVDRAIVRFNDAQGLPKFQINKNSTKLYIPQNGDDYAVVNSEAQGVVPVSFSAAEDGVYTLSVDADGVEVNYLHLVDNMTGADVDLLALRQAQGPASYSFEAKTTDYASRFKLVFASNGEDGASTGSAAFAFYSNGSWVIGNEGESTLQVVDLEGRILSSEAINGSCSKSVKAAAGVYLLRLINGDNVKVQKIVVE